jgi:hypothetical protein
MLSKTYSEIRRKKDYLHILKWRELDLTFSAFFEQLKNGLQKLKK